MKGRHNLGVNKAPGARMRKSNRESQIIALDCDGVLLDYSTAYGMVWERAFGEQVALKSARAYWPIDRWGVRYLSGDELQHLRAQMDETFWSTIPAIEGAVQACSQLRSMGYTLVCVTAIAPCYLAARTQNLRDLGFEVERVIATGADAYQESPKAAPLHQLRPVAFVDDYAPYLVGVSDSIHKALIDRDPEGSPNVGEALAAADSVHASLQAFVRFWERRVSDKLHT